MKKKKQIKWQNAKMRIIVVLLIIGFLLTLPVSFNFLQHSLFEERSGNAEQLMSQVARNVDFAMNSQWELIEHFVESFYSHKPESTADALIKLKEINKTTGDYITKLYLIDTNSYCYQSDGTRFRWTNGELLYSGKPECQIASAQFLQNDEYASMFFIYPFEENITIEGKNYSHMGVTVSMEFIDSFFNISYFEGNTISYILRANGSQVYKQQTGEELSQVYNLISALEKADYQWDSSHEQMVKSIEAKETGCVSLLYEGKSYYLVYAPLSVNDWVSVMMIPEENIATGAKGFMTSIIAIVIMLAVFAIAILLTVVISINSNARKQLELAAQAEREANQAKTKFLSSMSHDIRTPMNAIVGMTTLALEHTKEPEYIENSLKKVKLASNHLLTLINDVLDISKVESGKMKLTPVNFLLESELETLRNVFQIQAEEKMQNFICNIDDSIIGKRVYADQLRLSQVMYNLLSNAIKYTPNRGTVEVTCSLDKIKDSTDKVRFEYKVADTGIGMSEEFQKEMYSTFTRENNEPQNDIQGTGLGLAICRQMVDLMSGTIECESKPGKGTTFIVKVVLQLSQNQEESVTEVLNGTEKRSLEDLEGLRILVAEDNDFNWEIDKEIMEMHGMIPERAENGKECIQMLQQAEEEYYDMILMDIQMPVMDGYEATKIIRSSESAYFRKIPIVAMTANAFAEDIQQCREAGMNAHLAKPFDIGHLLEIIMNYGNE